MLVSDLIVPLLGDPWSLRPPLSTNCRVVPMVLVATFGLAAFYKARGCVAVAFGDGSDNEKGEPDVLQAKSPVSSGS
jgi:hypothetical protein